MSCAHPARSLFVLKPLAAALLLAFPAFASAAAELPDLGTPKPSASRTTLQPAANGFTVDSRDTGSRLTATAESSQRTDSALGLRGAFALAEGAALGGGLMAGRNKTELFANLGWNLDAASRLVLTGAQLKQKLDFDFPSGKARADMTQNAFGASYRYRLGGSLIDHAEFTAYAASTASRDLGDVDYTVDTAALYELWRDPRRVAGGKVSGFQGRLGLTPWQGGGVKLGLGQERLAYDLSTGAETHNRATASANLEQALTANLRLKAGYEGMAAQGRATFGLDVRLADLGTLGLEVASIKGRDGAPGDNRLQVSWTFPLGRMAGGSGAAPLANLRPAAQAMPSPHAAFSDSDLLDQVAQRPGWLPSQVVAKRDTTAAPTRLIAIDKTALPAGSSIGAGGVVTTPLGVAVTSIAGVTKNAVAFANAGQFALSGNSLVINPNLIAQPAVGVTDIYVVTANNFGGGTTLVTINVSRGSVKIDSIVVSAGDTTPPTTSAHSVSAITYLSATFSATINEAGTGYYVVVLAADAAPSVAQIMTGKNAAGTAAVNSGSSAMAANSSTNFSITGLVPSTAYKVYFAAKDSANNNQPAATSDALATTADTFAPSTQVMSSTNIGSTSASVILQINEAGTGYYILRLTANPAASAATLFASGTSVALTGGVSQQVNFAGLSPATSYSLDFVAKDVYNNQQGSASGVSFTTTP